MSAASHTPTLTPDPGSPHRGPGGGDVSLPTPAGNTPPAASPRVPLIVGVTGHMEINQDDLQTITPKIERVLEWLRQGPWPEKTDACCRDPLGLSAQTPVVVLSSLAPGADQLVAEAALKLGYHVRCPLPFPAEFYRNASTFRQGTPAADGTRCTVTTGDAESLPPHQREKGLWVPSDADRQRQAAFDAILARIGSAHTFFVHRKEDVGLSDNDLEERLASDLRDRLRRNLRYRAAGEYVSAYSDILIAICEQPDPEAPQRLQPDLPPLAQPGASLIARSHLNGLEPGILPLGTSLTWANNGPVVRIFCPNAKAAGAPDGGAPPAGPPLPVGHVALWHPKDSAIPEEFAPDWHRREMRLFRSLAGRIDMFNQDAASLETSPSPPPLGNPESARLLQKKPPFRPQTSIGAAWKSTRESVVRMRRLWRPAIPSASASRPPSPSTPPSSPVSPALEQIARLRGVASSVNRYLWDPQVKNLTTTLFLITGLVVLFAQAYENAVVTPGVHGTPLWRLACFWIAVCLFFAALGLHRWKKHRDIFDRQNDSRALAEGLRVQFYWSAAGLGLSAASHYLQQVKGETSWIRSAIASPSFPYEDEWRRFRALSPEEKHRRLSAVCDGWLGEQNVYFSRLSQTMSRTRHRIHRTANVCLIAGFALILLNFIQHCSPHSGAGAWCRSVATAVSWKPLLWWTTAVAAVWLVVQAVTEMTYRSYYDLRRRTRWVALSRFFHRFAAGLPLWILLWLLGLSLGWAVFTGVAKGGIDRFGQPSPQWNNAAKNLLMAAGGLLHSYAAVKFLTENSRRYTSMRDLFRTAEMRLRRLLKEYETENSRTPPRSDEQQRLLDAIHAQLAALGEESLHENTSWLLMHRDKPIEPPLPVG